MAEPFEGSVDAVGKDSRTMSEQRGGQHGMPAWGSARSSLWGASPSASWNGIAAVVVLDASAQSPPWQFLPGALDSAPLSRRAHGGKTQ